MSDLKSKIQNLDEERIRKNAEGSEKARINLLTKETRINDTTGEVQETTLTQSIRKSKEPSFIKLYIADLMLVNNLPSKASGVLWELIKITTFNNKIVLNSSIKKDICEVLNIKMPTLNNTLSSFVKKEILFRIDTGVYSPNPYLFARGKWEDIEKLRMIVDYSKGEKNVHVQVNGQEAIDINNEETIFQDIK